ncbi:MAG TPA: hypothetical protein VGH50_01320 [Candidatus Binatia bacterium]|jgi:hypothetical protein
MKTRKLFVSAAILAGSLAAGAIASASDSVVVREVLSPESNYCHLQFPPISENTLGTDNPVLKDPDSGDLIDFYGPCDENPLGPDQVRIQKQESQRRHDIEREE